MPKIAFMGAGSTVFAKNVLGDSMMTPALEDSVIALYDIDAVRLEDSKRMLDTINRNNGSKATIETYLGVENRKAALRGANYVVDAIQVGGYEPCTVTDFEIPKNTACARPSRIRWASAASSARCAPSRCCSILRAIWKKSARMRGSSITPTPWPCSPAPCSAIRA